MVCGSAGRRRRRARAAAAARAPPAPRPAIGASASVVGQVEEDPLDLLVDRRGQQRQRLVARLLGREGRVGGVGAERGVHARRHRAERRAGASRKRLGVARRARRARAPSRRGAPARNSCSDAERRVDQLALVLVPAGQRRDVREAARGRKRSSSSSGLTPGSTRRNAFSTSASSKTIDELDCSAPIGRTVGAVPRRLDARRASGTRRARARRRPSAPSRSRREQLARLAGRRARRRRVQPSASAITRLGPALVGRPQAERQLVELVRAGREARLDQRERPARRLRRAASTTSSDVERARPRAPWSRTSAAADEPLARASPRRARPGQRLPSVSSMSSSGSSLSWNQ